MLDPNHLKIEAWPPRQIGGQQVGTGPSGVKITHLPTGLTVTCEHMRSQHLNRKVAMEMIEWGISSTQAA